MNPGSGAGGGDVIRGPCDIKCATGFYARASSLPALHQ